MTFRLWPFSGPLPVPPRPGPSLGELALAVMVSELGHGEAAGNNTGPDVMRYFAALGKKPPGNWCAAVVSYAFKLSAARASLSLPFELSAGAKRLAKNVAAAGRSVAPGEAQGGDVIAWHRGKAGSWTGHVGMVEFQDPKTGLLHTIEGNVGPPGTAKVRRLIHDVTHERVYLIARV